MHWDITQLGVYPLILGIPWLRKYNPNIDWRRNRIYLPDHQTSTGAIKVKGLPLVPSAPSSDMDISWVGPADLQASSILPGAKSGTLLFSPDLDGCTRPSAMVASALGEPTFPEEIPDPPDYTSELLKLVPDQYHDLLSAFSKTRADTLPPHRPYDLSIDLEEGKTPPYGPLYSLSATELQALSAWLDENLSKGFIRASQSPAGAPILFVKKKDGVMIQKDLTHYIGARRSLR